MVWEYRIRLRALTEFNCHRMLDLSAVEEMGQNESILISVHEVVEMVEEAPTISTSHVSSTLHSASVVVLAR